MTRGHKNRVSVINWECNGHGYLEKVQEGGMHVDKTNNVIGKSDLLAWSRTVLKRKDFSRLLE